jgi:hypothetical protein
LTPDNGSTNSSNSDLIPLDISESLQQQQILTEFVISKKTACIVASLNHVYSKKTVVSNTYRDWNKTIDAFDARAKKKGISNEHVDMLTDALDDNNQKIMECYFAQMNKDSNGSDDRAAVALELVKDKIVDIFLDEVKAPYAVIKVNEHVETVPIKNERFEDWLGALYYNHEKGQGHNSVLSKEGIGRVQSVLSFEAQNKDVKMLHVRVAAFVDAESTNLDENIIFYDLCNKNWETVKITRHGWEIGQNCDQILFKRFPIMNEQVYPLKPLENEPDIMDQFIKLTNVYDDEDTKLLAKVYLVSLFLLASLPKPLMIPHGIHGSGKSTLQEFIKQVVDPAAALTTAFPDSISDLVQTLSHSYLTFFDNVSVIKDVTSDQICHINSVFSNRIYGTKPF